MTGILAWFIAFYILAGLSGTDDTSAFEANSPSTPGTSESVRYSMIPATAPWLLLTLARTISQSAKAGVSVQAAVSAISL